MTEEHVETYTELEGALDLEKIVGGISGLNTLGVAESISKWDDKYAASESDNGLENFPSCRLYDYSTRYANLLLELQQLNAEFKDFVGWMKANN